MNLCVVSKGSFTKEDYMELYNFFKDDIEKAERNLLVISWVGVIVSIGIITFSFWGIL